MNVKIEASLLCWQSHWGCVDKTLGASDASASVSCSNPEQCLEIDMADGFASQFWLDQGYKYNHTLHPECNVGKCDLTVYPSHESTEPIKGYTGVEQLKYGKPPAVEAFSDKPLIYVQVQCFDKKCKEDCNGGPIPQKTCIGSTGESLCHSTLFLFCLFLYDFCVLSSVCVRVHFLPSFSVTYTCLFIARCCIYPLCHSLPINVPEYSARVCAGGGAAMLECFPTYLQQQLWTNGDCTGPAANTTKQMVQPSLLSRSTFLV